jgi:hypothetical protein
MQEGIGYLTSVMKKRVLTLLCPDFDHKTMANLFGTYDA